MHKLRWFIIITSDATLVSLDVTKRLFALLAVETILKQEFG